MCYLIKKDYYIRSEEGLFKGVNFSRSTIAKSRNLVYIAFSADILCPLFSSIMAIHRLDRLETPSYPLEVLETTRVYIQFHGMYCVERSLVMSSGLKFTDQKY